MVVYFGTLTQIATDKDEKMLNESFQHEALQFKNFPEHSGLQRLDMYGCHTTTCWLQKSFIG
jgi:hypothetical protein